MKRQGNQFQVEHLMGVYAENKQDTTGRSELPTTGGMQAEFGQLLYRML